MKRLLFVGVVLALTLGVEAAGYNGVEWDPSPQAEFYTVVRVQDPARFDVLWLCPDGATLQPGEVCEKVTETSWPVPPSDEADSIGGNWYYRITAGNEIGESTFSNPVGWDYLNDVEIKTPMPPGGTRFTTTITASEGPDGTLTVTANRTGPGEGPGEGPRFITD